MKACVLEAVNKLEYKDVPTPTPAAGEVLLRIKASGICSSDFSRVFKTGTYHFPTIPGHEFAGEIVQVGEGVDTALTGRRAVVFPLLPCNECEQCKLGNYALCSNYNYFGSRCDGGFAEYLAAPLWNIRLFADAVPYEVAALTEPAAVAWHAVAKARIQPGESVFISGSGTIGILCGIWARKQGAKVSFMVRNKQKAQLLQKTWGFGTIRTDADDKALASRPDLILECVGTPLSIQTAIDTVKTAGRIVLVGNPSGDIDLPKPLYWKILRSELSIQGIWNSVYPVEWDEVLEQIRLLKDSLAPLITHQFPLSTGQGAFEQLRDSKELILKAIYINE